MKNQYAELDRFVYSLLDKVKVMKYDQLLYFVMKEYNFECFDDAHSYISGCQRNCHFVTTLDKFVLTKEKYFALTTDYEFRKRDKRFNYQMNISIEGLLSLEDKRMIDCLWFVVDAYPKSKDFMVCKFPYNIVFTTANTETRQGRVFIITRISTNYANSILSATQKAFYGEDKAFSTCDVHIAMIDSESVLDNIPSNMFDYLCILDDSVKRRFKFVEILDDDEDYEDEYDDEYEEE